MPGSRRLLWYVAMAALVIFGYILGCTTQPSGAAGAAREEYKVVAFEGGGNPNNTQLEALLNQNAKEGWKFRAIYPGTYAAIMAR